jgi:enoyl-CoA hydratase
VFSGADSTETFASGVHFTVTRGIGLITIDRPATRKAISVEVMADLATILDRVGSREDISVIGVRGAGDRAFVSGGDLKSFASIRSFDAALTMARTMRDVLDRLASIPMPTVALLNGDAYGGGAELAVACDMRMAADHVKIGFTQARLGLMPAWGGIERLTSLVGRGRASYLLATGEVLSASDARIFGLVEVVHSRAEFEKEAWGLLKEIAEVPADPGRAIKRIIGAVAPGRSPDTAVEATTNFAQSWIADEHWTMAGEADRRRRGKSVKSGT